MANHLDNFSTAPTSAISAGATTSPLNDIPSIAAPFYLAFDATNINGHYEVRSITSKTATNVNHAALTYAHSTDEKVRMIVPAVELDATTTAVTNVTTNLGDGSAVLGMARQAIMNGNFDIWQRGTSVALADLGAIYQADRWRDYTDKNGGTLPTLTRTSQFLIPGDIPNCRIFSRLATDGAGTSLGVSSVHMYNQTIENGTAKLCGLNKTVTVSFWARSDIANKRICPTLLQGYGTGGSPTATEIIKGTPITLTSTWTKYTATFTTNTLVGKTLGTNNDDSLNLTIYDMWGATYGNTYVQTSVTAETFVGAGNIDIAQVLLCAGDVALPFQPKPVVEETRDCQRFCRAYPASTFQMNAAGTPSANIISGVFNFEKMRIAPGSVNPTFNASDLDTNPITVTGINGLTSTETSIKVDLLSTCVAGKPYRIAIASGTLILSADL